MESIKILVVDDEAPVREMIKKGLSQMGGYSVEVAQNGAEAIEKIEKDVFDLVLTDLMMPEIDGFAVLEALRSKPETAAIPVIVATAKELTPDEKNRLSGQIQALMQKGDFLNDEFLEEVKSLIK